MFGRECTKLFLKPLLLLMLVLTVVLNGVLLYVSEMEKTISSQSKPAGYKRLWEELKGYSVEEAYAYCLDQSELINIMDDIDIMERFGGFDQEPWLSLGLDEKTYSELLLIYQTGSYLKYTSTLREEVMLYREVMGELDASMGYSQYISGILENTEGALKRAQEGMSSLYSSGYAIRNFEDILKAYGRMTDVKTDIGPSRGICLVLENRITDIFALFFIMLVVLMLVTTEREKNLLMLVKSTKEGRERLGVCKLLLLYLTCLLMMLLHMESLLVGGELYGLGALHRSIQSVYGYQGCVLKLNVGEFLAFNFLARFLFYCVCASAMYFVSCIFRRSIYVVSVIFSVIVLSVALYENISNTSNLLTLKHTSFMGLSRTEEILGAYGTIRVGNFPVDRLWFSLLEALLLLGLFSALAVFAFSRTRERENRRLMLFSRVRRLLKIYPGSHTCSLLHESVKALLTSKALLILLIGAGAYLVSYKPVSADSDMVTIVYREMIGQVSGRADKIDPYYWEKLEDGYEQIYSEISGQEGQENRLISIQYSLQAINALKEHGDYLAAKKGSWYLDSTGYELLTGGDERYTQSDLRTSFFVALVSSIVFVAVFGVDHQSNEVRLLRTTENGRGRRQLQVSGIGVVLSLAIWGVFWLPQLFEVYRLYGFHALSAPAYSMEHLAAVPSFISIGAYLVFMYLTRFLGILLIMGLCELVVSKLKSFVLSFGVAFGVTVVPVCFALLGISFCRYILLMPFILGRFI